MLSYCKKLTHITFFKCENFKCHFNQELLNLNIKNITHLTFGREFNQELGNSKLKKYFF